MTEEDLAALERIVNANGISYAPRLIAEIRRLQAENTRLRAALDDNFGGK